MMEARPVRNATDNYFDGNRAAAKMPPMASFIATIPTTSPPIPSDDTSMMMMTKNKKHNNNNAADVNNSTRIAQPQQHHHTTTQNTNLYSHPSPSSSSSASMLRLRAPINATNSMLSPSFTSSSSPASPYPYQQQSGRGGGDDHHHRHAHHVISIHREEEEDDDDAEDEKDIIKRVFVPQSRQQPERMMMYTTSSASIPDYTISAEHNSSSISHHQHQQLSIMQQDRAKSNNRDEDDGHYTYSSMMKRVEDLMSTVSSLERSNSAKDDIIAGYERVMRRGSEGGSGTLDETKNGSNSGPQQQQQQQAMLLDEFQTYLLGMREEVVVLRDRLQDWQRKEESSRQEARQLRTVLDKLQRSEKDMTNRVLQKMAATTPSSTTSLALSVRKGSGDSCAATTSSDLFFCLKGKLKDLQDRLAYACLQKGELHAQLASVHNLENCIESITPSSSSSSPSSKQNYRFRGKAADIQLRLTQQDRSIESIRSAIDEVERTLRSTSIPAGQRGKGGTDADHPSSSSLSFLWNLCRGCGNMQYTSRYCPETGHAHLGYNNAEEENDAKVNDDDDDDDATETTRDENVVQDSSNSSDVKAAATVVVATNLSVRPSLHGEVTKLLSALEKTKTENLKLKKLLRAIAKTGKLGIPPPLAKDINNKEQQQGAPSSDSQPSSSTSLLIPNIITNNGSAATAHMMMNNEGTINMSVTELKALDKRVGTISKQNTDLSQRCTDLILALSEKEEELRVAQEKLKSVTMMMKTSPFDHEDNDNHGDADEIHLSAGATSSPSSRLQYRSDVSEYHRLMKLQQTVDTLQDDVAMERRQNSELREALRQARQDLNLLLPSDTR